MMFMWKSVWSFKQHIADMKLFRQKHADITGSRNNMVGNMPMRGDIEPAYSRGGSKIIITTRRKTKLVPIWEIELPRGVQN